MKRTKLLTSLATFVLVLGLGACETTSDNTSSEASGGDTSSSETTGGTTEGGEEGEGDIVFGFELEGELNAIDGGYVLDSDGNPYLYELTYTSNLDDALRFTYEAGEAVGEYYISTEIDGVTTWVTIVTGDHTNVNYVTEKAPLYYNSTYECWGNEEQTYFLCCNTSWSCFYCSTISQYINSSPIAGLYYTDGSKVTGFVGVVQEEIEIDEASFETVKTGRLGVFQENLNYYYYFTGKKSGNFADTTTEWDEAVEVTLLKDENYYYLRFYSNEEKLYFANTDTSNSQVSLSESPYPMQYNEQYDAYLSTDGTRFIATYGTYNTLSWAELKYLGDESEYIAHIYESEQTQPEHEPEPELPDGAISTTVTYETIMNHSTFASHTWITEAGKQDTFSTTDGVVTGFDGFGITWYTDASGSSNGCAIYTGDSGTDYSLRIYKYAHFDIAATEGYEIYSTEVYTSSNGNNNLTCTNGSNTVWANYTYTTDGPTDSTAPIVYANGYAGSKNVVIGYITIVVVPTAA